MIWYEIPDVAGYRISPHAEVMDLQSDPPALVKAHVNKGCYILTLGQRSYSLHELMARVFLGPCPPGMQTGVKDGNKLNARLSNLHYVPIPRQYCRHRHELTPDNIYWRPGRGGKVYKKCKRCQIQATLRSRAKRASAPSASGAPGS